MALALMFGQRRIAPLLRYIVTNNKSFKNGLKTETLKGLFESDIFFCPSLIHFDSVIESETSL